MTPEALIQELQHLVRRCFPPDRQIEFSEGHGGPLGSILDVHVIARVEGSDLRPYDDKALVQLSGGQLKESKSTSVVIRGRKRGYEFELRVLAGA
jgi:hypothetical protein